MTAQESEHLSFETATASIGVRSDAVSQTPAHLVVMTPQEVAMVLSKLRGARRLMASVLYGAGLRLSECASLRVKEMGFAFRS